jgi:hypothetical protein
MWTFWILVVIGFALLIYSWTCKNYDYNGLVGMIGVILILIAPNKHIKESKPSAIDVYRGNTELKITSVNGVPTDTIVIFKNK